MRWQPPFGLGPSRSMHWPGLLTFLGHDKRAWSGDLELEALVKPELI